MPDLEKRLRDLGSLPTAPGVALEILRLNEREDADMSELAEIVSKDPAIGSRLLRTANSSAFGRQGMVSNFHEAVMLLGSRRVNMLALSFSLSSACSRPANEAFNYTLFWTASAVHTVAARAIAGRFAENLVDETFVAGLLCNLGQLVLAEYAADLYQPVLDAHGEGEEQVHEIEARILGTNHASLARELFLDWGLPTSLCEAIGGHHDPDTIASDDETTLTLAKILHLAGACSDLYVDNDVASVDEILVLGSRYFEMAKEDCEALFESLRNEVSEFLEILEPSNMDAAESNRLKARASERLMEENLHLEQRYQSVSIDLERMSRRVAELETIARVDPLTGLQTRVHFEELADKHLRLAALSHSSTGLLMIDIDKFKRINDGFGHLCGDTVLTAIGETLNTVLSPPSVIARWGGDEFIALCPGVGPDELLDLAETVLREVGQRHCKWESETIRPTVSIGGTVVNGSTHCRELGQMVLRADAELYHAKEAGRNKACVSEFEETEA